LPTQQIIARDDAATAIHFPIRLLTIALVLTTVAFAWFGWIIFDERRDAKMFQDESLRTEELRGVIIHLDEVLTMSARMAAATGDPKWEERYRRFEPQLDAAIKETTKLGMTLHDSKAAARTDEANIKLVEMENRAFALVRAGRKEEAQAVVFSPEYEAQKKIYAEGINSFNSQIRREVDEHERQDNRIDFLSIFGALVVLVISFAAWLSVVRGLQRWRVNLEHAVSERKQAEQALRRAHDELEVRVEQRTAELGRTNQALQAEITERLQAEMASTRLAAIVESSDDAIIGKTLDGYVTSWNRGAEMVFGYSRKEMTGKHISVLIPDDRKDEEPGIMKKIKRGESVNHYETVRRRKDGWLIDISVTVSPIRDAHENIIGASKVARDITERRRLEKEIIEISNREQQRIGQDLHDGLCQELTGIELMCQVLEQKLATKSKPESKQVGEITQHIRDAISHTRKLAHGLSPVELATNGFMSALYELAMHIQKLFRIECRIECPKPVLIRNNLFATHLYRIVQEAINNAVKHGKAKNIFISLKPAGDRFALTVADDGIGFSNETKKSGGMGLHIMKYRAGVLDAALEVRSNIDGLGTSVICVFRKKL
jgi:PAS domain S-box-containing protein